MRILRFMGYPISNFSTLERMMLAQAHALRTAGHQLDIAFDGIRRPEAAVAARDHAPGIGLHFDLPDRFGMRHLRPAVEYARAASRLIKEGNYDIVHVYFNPSASLLNQVARLHPSVRFVRTIGSTPVPSGNRRYLDSIKQRRWVFDTAQMHKLICVGDHISEMLADFGVRKDKLVVVPNATDVDKFRRRIPHSRADKFRLAFIGRMNQVKNIPLIIEGVRLLVEQGETDIHLTLIGAGELRDALMAQVERDALSTYISFAGHIDDIPGMLDKNVDVYVQASHNEGCPAAVIEAMACEVPVLLSDIPGHRQVAAPDCHATYFRPSDAADFAQAVRRMKADFSRYQAMAMDARRHIVDTYSIDAWIGKELAIYESLMPARIYAAAR